MEQISNSGLAIFNCGQSPFLLHILNLLVQTNENAYSPFPVVIKKYLNFLFPANKMRSRDELLYCLLCRFMFY